MTSTGTFITINFPPGLYKKAGFDMSVFYGGQLGIFTIKVTSGSCIYNYQQAGAAGQRYYFGIELPTTIDKIEVKRNTDLLIIDNFMFAN